MLIEQGCAAGCKEFSASYSIIAHEVGHFISWTYGYWPGSISCMKTSLNEGMSMALPAVWGKARPKSSLAYTDSAKVTTGSFAGGPPPTTSGHIILLVETQSATTSLIAAP